MGGEAKATMLTYIGRDDAGAEPGVDSINAYPEAVQWLLLTYARESVLHDAYREVRDMVQGVGEKEQQFAARLRKSAIRCGDVFREQDLITIYVGGLKAHARYAVRESLSRTEKRTFQQIREHAQSLGDTFREQQRELGKLKSNFEPKKTTSRRASVLSIDTDDSEPQGDNEVLAVMAEGNSYNSSRSTPSSTTAPTRSTDRYERGQPQTRGMIRVPSDRTLLQPSSLPKPDVKEFTLGRGKYFKPYLCLLCRKYGHSMVDCNWLTDEQHQKAKKLQQEVPLTDAERRFLRDVKVALAEVRSDTFGSSSSSDSDKEDGDGKDPGKGKEERK